MCIRDRPLDHIEANIKIAKSLTKNAPFYVLGPLVTDVTPGYDHISGAIGGAVAAMYGADFLCYVTPAEHLSIPTEEDVKEGVIASKIAAHVADYVRGFDREFDEKMGIARRSLNWEEQFRLSIDPEKAKFYHNRFPTEDTCTMCGDYCVFKILDRYLKIGR